MQTYGISSLFVILYCANVYGTDCPDNWVAFEGSCYLFGNDLLSFVDAEKFCNSQRSYLVHVESKQENTFLQNFLQHFKLADYWLGMTDAVMEGAWLWHGDDTLVNYFDWGPTEPQNHNNEDCAIMGYYIGYRWADVRCSTDRKPICEMVPGGNVIIG